MSRDTIKITNTPNQRVGVNNTNPNQRIGVSNGNAVIFNIPPATNDKLGSVKIAKDGGLNILPDGTLSVDNTKVGAPRYTKTFQKGDWIQIGGAPQYYISISQKEHGLTTPYVNKVVLDKIETETDGQITVTEVTAPIVCKERLLSTGTIKLYITIDLSVYSNYSGKIYLMGE